MYLSTCNFCICQNPLGLSIDYTYQTMELVNEFFLTGKFRKFDTPF